MLSRNELNTIKFCQREDTKTTGYEMPEYYQPNEAQERSQINQLIVLYSVGEGVIIIDQGQADFAHLTAAARLRLAVWINAGP